MIDSKQTICGLADWGLSPVGLRRLGARSVHLTIQQKGPRVESLIPYRPSERQAKIAASLARGLRSIARRCPAGELKVRGDRGLAWTIDTRVPARAVTQLAALPNVAHVSIRKISGVRRLRPRAPDQGWFAVRGRVAVQVEGQTSGYQTVEDRLVLVKARDCAHAERRLRRGWQDYAKPHINLDGYLVRWQLEEVVDVYAVLDDQIASDGTEVYSEMKQRRMRPDYEWHPRASEADA